MRVADGIGGPPLEGGTGGRTTAPDAAAAVLAAGGFLALLGLFQEQPGVAGGEGEATDAPPTLDTEASSGDAALDALAAALADPASGAAASSPGAVAAGAAGGVAVGLPYASRSAARAPSTGAAQDAAQVLAGPARDTTGVVLAARLATGTADGLPGSRTPGAGDDAALADVKRVLGADGGEAGRAAPAARPASVRSARDATIEPSVAAPLPAAVAAAALRAGRADAADARSGVDAMHAASDASPAHESEAGARASGDADGAEAPDVPGTTLPPSDAQRHAPAATSRETSPSRGQDALVAGADADPTRDAAQAPRTAEPPPATRSGDAVRASVTPGEPAGLPTWIERVGAAARLERRARTLRFDLEPSGLGRIEVRLSLARDGVRAMVVAEHEHTRALLAHQQPALAAALERSELRLESFLVDVDLGGAADGERAAHGDADDRPPLEDAPPDAARVAAPDHEPAVPHVRGLLSVRA